MLTLTNSYWCLFIIESDSEWWETARRGSRSSTEMKLCPNLARMNLINLFQASVLFSIDTKVWGGWNLGRPHAAREHFLARARACLRSAGKVNTDEEDRNRAARCVCENEIWQRWNSSVALLSSHRPQLRPCCCPMFLSHFPCSVLFSLPWL